METQTVIDFTKSHGRENNPISEHNYSNDLEHYNNQCRIVLEQLLTGKRLTTMSAMMLGIGDMRRRAKDLRDIHNIPIKDSFKKGTRFKEWWLESSFINQFLSA